MTPDLVLYHFPGACSRVAVCALEMAGLAYELRLVNCAQGEQTRDDYKAVSALGKVPAMLIDGAPLLENSAILTFVHALRPDAGILPPDASPQRRAEGVSGLSFCSGTLHPIVRGLFNPQRLTTGDGEPVRAKARELAASSFGYADRRLAERGGWWTGQATIVDIYLDWAMSVARKAGFDFAALPALDGLAERLGALPAYRRMQAEEARSFATLGLPAG